MKLTKEKTSNYISTLVFSVFRYAILLAIGYVILLPLFTMISYSVKPEADIFDPSVVWMPKSVTFQNFKDAIEAMDYWAAFGRTIFLEIIPGLIQVLVAAATAYAFARFNFRFKKLLNAILILTILIPTPMIIVSLYTNFSSFNFLGIGGLLEKITGLDLTPMLLNTPFVFYLPSICAVGLKSGLCILIFIQFLKGLPKELEEAASIDGAGPFETFTKIIIPSSGIAILTVTIFTVIWHWNDYYLCGMYYSENYPLAVNLSTAFTKNVGSMTMVLQQMAGCLLFIIPVLIFYLIVQRWFIQSIDRIGIVG